MKASSTLHVRIQEWIKALIAVMSRLDAVVACIKCIGSYGKLTMCCIQTCAVV